MSADNGIYILVTKSNTPGMDNEYRVAYLFGIDNIYGDFDDVTGKYEPNVEMILNCFNGCHVFHYMDFALESALQLEDIHPNTEYGICVISEFKDIVIPFS